MTKEAETIDSVTEAASWIRDERDQAEASLAEILALLDRLDESGESYDTDTIRALIPVDLTNRVSDNPAGNDMEHARLADGPSKC